MSEAKTAIVMTLQGPQLAPVAWGPHRGIVVTHSPNQHGTPRFWCVTHAPSGYRFPSFLGNELTRAIAVTVAKELSEAMEWDVRQWTLAHLRAAYRISLRRKDLKPSKDSVAKINATVQNARERLAEFVAMEKAGASQ